MNIYLYIKNTFGWGKEFCSEKKNWFEKNFGRKFFLVGKSLFMAHRGERGVRVEIEKKIEQIPF